MVAVLVILDGASEPLRDGEPTSLEVARTPVLDRLARDGELARVRTVAPGLSPGSEAAIPALLGWSPPERVDRGALEAAAYGIEVPEGERAWRVDVVAARVGAPSAAEGATASRAAELEGARARDAGARGAAPVGEAAARGGAQAFAAAALQAWAPDHAVHLLAGHRLLVVGPAPLPEAALAAGLRVWPEGIVPPRILGPDTVVVGARGAAVGAARIMGADTIVPAGATGLPSSNLAAKAHAALRAIAGGAERVVVHVGGPDEASHQRDRAAKVRSIEAADRALVGPLAAAVARAGGTLTVCPDHGCDPATGEHDAAPVPRITWTPARATLPVHILAPRTPLLRLTERAVAHLPAQELATVAAAFA